MTPAAVQLRLFDDTPEIACPHCGHRFDPRAVLRAAHQEASRARRQRVLQHPALATCSTATREFVAALPSEFWAGLPVGGMDLHRFTGYAQATVFYHLSKLVRRGIVEAVPKRPGGTYSQYRLVLHRFQ